MKLNTIYQGDYVLVTKYADGDPSDDWCIGFYRGEWKNGSQVRHDVVDHDGKLFRGNGFRRVEKVTQEEAVELLANKDVLVLSGSIWKCLKITRKRIQEAKDSMGLFK